MHYSHLCYSPSMKLIGEKLAFYSSHNFGVHVLLTRIYNSNNNCLTAVFQNNLGKPVPERLHSRFYSSKDDGDGGDNWSQIVTTNKPTPSFVQAICPYSRPTNSVKPLKGKYHISWTCSSQAHLGIFQPCL